MLSIVVLFLGYFCLSLPRFCKAFLHSVSLLNPRGKMSDKAHEQVRFLEPFVIQLFSRWDRNGRLQMLKIWELLCCLQLASTSKKQRARWAGAAPGGSLSCPPLPLPRSLCRERLPEPPTHPVTLPSPRPPSPKSLLGTLSLPLQIRGFPSPGLCLAGISKTSRKFAEPQAGFVAGVINNV